MDKKKVKKILNTVLNVVLIVFLVICIAVVAITLLSSRDADGAANIFGYQLRVVTSGSMEKSDYTDVSEYDIKSIPIKSMVLIEKVPDNTDEVYDWYDALDEGDVLTFRYLQGGKQITITHRITEIEKKNGGFVIDLEGDNKSSEDGAATQLIDTTVPNNPNYVIGKVVGKSVIIGNIVTALNTTLGMVLIIILPCFAIILYEAIKIWKTIQDDKKTKTDSEISDKNREIEELKKKLAEMSAAVENAAEKKIVDASEEKAAEDEVAVESAAVTEEACDVEEVVTDTEQSKDTAEEEEHAEVDAAELNCDDTEDESEGKEGIE